MKAAPSTPEQLALEHALLQVLNRYATAVDTRNLALLDQVFTADCTATYGGSYVCQGAAEIRRMIDVHMGAAAPHSTCWATWRSTPPTPPVCAARSMCAPYMPACTSARRCAMTRWVITRTNGYSSHRAGASTAAA